MPKKLEGEVDELRLTVPKTLKGYLTLLAKDHFLGAATNDLAVFILTKEVQRMFEADYHGKKVPTAEETEE